MKKIISFLLIIIILGIGILISKYFLTHKIKPIKQKYENKGPIVNGIKVIKKDIRVNLIETGTVRPFRQVSLIPQVSGKVVYISPNFYIGKIVKKGESLIKLERIDYEVAYFRALEQLKKAELNYEKILEEAKISRHELKSAKEEFKIKKPSKLKLFIPQMESAKATLEFAKKNFELAKVNLKRTKLRSPFYGIVSKKYCEIGEFVPIGKIVGVIIDISKVYVITPIPDYEIPFLDFKSNKVKINLNLKGLNYIFYGKLLRTSKIIDKRTRTIDLIIEVNNPYKIIKDNVRLFIGAFVEVEIKGKLLKDVAKIPSFAIHNGNEIWIYKNGKLFIKKTKIIKRVKDYVYVREGINNGDILITTHLPYVSNGMNVRLMNNAMAN